MLSKQSRQLFFLLQLCFLTLIVNTQVLYPVKYKKPFFLSVDNVGELQNSGSGEKLKIGILCDGIDVRSQIFGTLIYGFKGIRIHQRTNKMFSNHEKIRLIL